MWLLRRIKASLGFWRVWLDAPSYSAPTGQKQPCRDDHLQEARCISKYPDADELPPQDANKLLQIRAEASPLSPGSHGRPSPQLGRLAWAGKSRVMPPSAHHRSQDPGFPRVPCEKRTQLGTPVARIPPPTPWLLTGGGVGGLPKHSWRVWYETEPEAQMKPPV